MRTKQAFVPASPTGMNRLEDRVVLSHSSLTMALAAGTLNDPPAHSQLVAHHASHRPAAQVSALGIDCVQQLFGFKCIPRDPGAVFTDPVNPTSYAIDIHNRSSLKVGLTFRWSTSSAPINSTLSPKFHRVFKLTTANGVAPNISFDRSTAPGLQLQSYKLPVTGRNVTNHYYFRTINSTTIGLFST